MVINEIKWEIIFFPWTLHAVEQILVFESTLDEYLKMLKKTEHRLKNSRNSHGILRMLSWIEICKNIQSVPFKIRKLWSFLGKPEMVSYRFSCPKIHFYR